MPVRFSVVLVLVRTLFAETLPDTPAALSALAANAFRNGNFAEARTLYESALARQVRFGPALAGLGGIDQIESRRTQAFQNLARAYQQNPDDPQVVRKYAEVAADPGLELRLWQRLLGLPRSSADDRERAREVLELRSKLAGRVINQLESPYRPYQLRMPLARRDDGRAHGWILRVEINGHRPLRLLVDTGARSVLVTKEKLTELRLEPLTEGRTGGFGKGNSAASTVMLADSLRVDAQLALKNVIVEAGDHSFVDGVDGLISPALFQHFLVTCNGRKKQLELAPFEGYDGSEGAGNRPWARLDPPPLGEGYQPFRRLGHLMVIEDRTKAGAHYVLDSGAGYSVVHQPLRSLDARTVSLLGASGSLVASHHDRPLSFNVVGRHDLTRDVVAMDLNPISEYFGVKLAGFLGFPVLQHQELSFDTRNGSVRITK